MLIIIAFAAGLGVGGALVALIYHNNQKLLTATVDTLTTKLRTATATAAIVSQMQKAGQPPGAPKA